MNVNPYMEAPNPLLLMGYETMTSFWEGIAGCKTDLATITPNDQNGATENGTY